MRRVVVTGIGFLSPLGDNIATLKENIIQKKSGVKIIESWSQEMEDMVTLIAAPVAEQNFNDIPRKYRRSMGRVAQMTARSMQTAIDDSGLEQSEIQNIRTGISFGSTMGANETLMEWITSVYTNKNFKRQNSMIFLKAMSHTIGANLAALFGIKGRSIPTCSACTSSSQAIGAGYESVKYGMSDIMFVGGAEGLHYLSEGVFEVIGASSAGYNDKPQFTPRPFDKNRDGLIIGEGAGTLVLEEYEHAKKRGAKIYAELKGYATTCDGNHLTTPSREGMSSVMRLSLADANLTPDRIGYINAHATATLKGDIEESHATHSIFGNKTPISSTKSYMGHLLGGCGVVESIISMMALNEKLIPANRNLDEVDEACANLDYILEHRDENIKFVMNNNFAFGGINTSLIFSKI
ncbi:beta-ketoacyl-[acyl-carrier-protein] synthase family protein [Sulfurovum sp. bin170]|uniref:beta-ketoacyl-[acyl-carrier-protein] synthase family protein n=1 Tax=Sulfurovum sp. bin170 TaxID=2695268 RepID=UPI0013DF976F|nr:beta-ketoacyl synthase N-terminal-like domain-containing protein [Sulfurovum sp. bin170]NEW61530.1 beta-ketoacyl-[acyl-carrier-protein] synthase family protein [Sulfurovum sp. bin170]